MIRAVRINVPLIDVLAGMPNYGKFLKELISNKQISAAFLSDESSAMIQNKVPPKLGDPGSFLIPCNFNKTFSCNALANLGASINLMPYSLYAKLSLETLKPTKISKLFRHLSNKHLDYKMLHRCKDAHIVLNWEMSLHGTKKEMCSDHKVDLSARLEVDKAKIDVISKLPPLPTSKLEKDTPFEFHNECQKAFEILKEKSMCSLMIVCSNWDLPVLYLCTFSRKQDAKHAFIRWILLLQEFDIEIKDRKGTGNVVADHLSRIENDDSSDDSEVDDNFPGETLMEINTKNEPWFADFANYLVGDIIPKGMTYQQKNKFFSDLKHYFWRKTLPFSKYVLAVMIRRLYIWTRTRTLF
ncbi:reverse transcriptase domain-containing protein [Tanacetum coccineum]